jgi:NDP-sugar pyrophosphorylase family protein
MIDDLDETFLVANGDLLTTMNLVAMVRQHSETRCDASIGIFERENKIDFGLVEFDAENRLSAYREKPTNMYYVSMGIYILQREAVRQNIAMGDYQDMPSLLLNMRAAKADVRCYHDDCMWLDIGRPDDFALAQSMFESNRALFLEE